jgi:hypothetical protein
MACARLLCPRSVDLHQTMQDLGVDPKTLLQFHNMHKDDYQFTKGILPVNHPPPKSVVAGIFDVVPFVCLCHCAWGSSHASFPRAPRPHPVRPRHHRDRHSSWPRPCCRGCCHHVQQSAGSLVVISGRGCGSRPNGPAVCPGPQSHPQVLASFSRATHVPTVARLCDTTAGARTHSRGQNGAGPQGIIFVFLSSPVFLCVSSFSWSFFSIIFSSSPSSSSSFVSFII